MMSSPEDLVAIITRIASNAHTDADRLRLQQIMTGAVAAGERSLAINGDANGATIATGDGSTILNIVFQADGLRIGKNLYQGDGAGVLRSLLQEVLLPKVTIDWQQSGRTLLDHQIQSLTTNPLTHAEGIVYRPEQVYVPLVGHLAWISPFSGVSAKIEGALISNCNDPPPKPSSTSLKYRRKARTGTGQSCDQ